MVEDLNPSGTFGAVNAPSAGAVSPGAVQSLEGTQGWVRLVGILLFIGAAFAGLAAVLMFFGGAMGSHFWGRAGGGAIAALGVPYILMAVLYGFMGNFLVNYASAIARLVKSGLNTDLERALEAQRKFWKLAGILVLVMLAVMILGILAAIAIPMMMALR
jgi:hypothetical protein